MNTDVRNPQSKPVVTPVRTEGTGTSPRPRRAPQRVNPEIAAARPAKGAGKRPLSDISKNRAWVKGRSSTFTFDLGNTWWRNLPALIGTFARLLFLPLTALKAALDMALTALFLVIFGSIGLWGVGYISDAVVISWFTQIGDRVLFIIRELGLPI